MDEYISREAVVRYLKGYSEHELNWNTRFGSITSSVLDKAERALSEMPAADVQPVKHGRWIENSDPGQNINEHYMCSECGSTFRNWANDNYCPNCGSKNRLDGDGND